MRIKFICILFISIIFFSCKRKVKIIIEQVNKVSTIDPFKETVTPSQHFSINTKEDNVIKGKKNTLVVFPKGCFINKYGEVENGAIDIELSESLEYGEMVLSNLTTQTNGKPLISDGMIFINATANGEQLLINKTNPIYIEIPTSYKIPEMKIFNGIRDSNGNMNWVNQHEQTFFLTTVDINTLNFYPEGFELEVENGMPFRSHEIADSKLKDSLYYSLSVSNGNELTNGFTAPKVNEAYYNNSKRDTSLTQTQFELDHFFDKGCGIDPAMIKVIKDKKYGNTFIATKAFEKRLQVIFKTCNKELLELYIKNIDKNLFEVDSMAYEGLTKISDFYAPTFLAFKEERLTNVKDANKISVILKSYYDKKYKSVKNDLDKVNELAKEELKKHNIIAEKTIEKYNEVLKERETDRMQAYGFIQTELGWINIDNGTIPKDWSSMKLEVQINSNETFDRIYTYVIYESLKSLYRLNTDDNKLFYVGNVSDKEMLMPNFSQTKIITIAYKGAQLYFGSNQSETKTSNVIQSLSLSSKDKLKEFLNQFSSFSKENRIDIDLQHQEELYKEQLRQNKLMKEAQFINKIWLKAFPCCNKGEQLFKANCTPCHAINSKVVGPALRFATKRYDCFWLIEFTRNSQKVIDDKEERAVKVFNEYNKSMMTSFPALSEQEIKSIFQYIDGYNNDEFNWCNNLY